MQVLKRQPRRFSASHTYVEFVFKDSSITAPFLQFIAVFLYFKGFCPLFGNNGISYLNDTAVIPYFFAQYAERCLEYIERRKPNEKKKMCALCKERAACLLQAANQKKGGTKACEVSTKTLLPTAAYFKP